MRSDENLIYTDFQGWPIYRMNLHEILMALGASRGTCNEYIICDDDNKFESIYPRVLEDDGMGYGVNERYITEVNLDNESEEPYCNIFAESKQDGN